MDSNTSHNLSLFDFPDNTVKTLLSDEFVMHFHTVCMSFTEVFSLFGCFSNIVNMIVFARQGFKDSINVSLFGLSLSDFGACFTLIWENIGFHPKVAEYLPFKADEVALLFFSLPHICCIKITTAITALIVFERCLCVVMPIKIKTIITTSRVKIFVISTFICVSASFIPLYYANRFGRKFNPDRNKSEMGIVFSSYREEIESASHLFHSFVLSVIPFHFIGVCTFILYINLKRKAVWRQSVTQNSTREMLTKDIKVARMIVQVSTLFIVCLFPFVIILIVMAVDEEIKIGGKKADIFLTTGSLALIPESFSSAVNIFFYYRNSSKYQAMFKKTFGTKK